MIKRCRGILISFLLMAWAIQSPVVAASQSTPVPTSEASPVFALVALGDHPSGYFDDVVVEPGHTKMLSVRVLNAGEVPADLRIFKANAMSAIDGGFAAGLEEDAPVGSTAWIEFPVTAVQLNPGESQDIEFSVTVPEDAAPGQYISGLVAQTADSFSFPGTDVLDYSLGYSISVGILVPGDLAASFEVGTPKEEIVGTTKVLDIPVVNTGNYLVRPTGSLSMSDLNGRELIAADIEMGSVYAGLSTSLQVVVPAQLPPGEYVISVALSDPESGASANAQDMPITIQEPKDSAGVLLGAAAIQPNADEIVFANVDVTLNNGGQQIPASDVTLDVLRDGEQVDSFPLATNQVLLNGENTYTTRYIPAGMWEPGTYTFRIVVSAVDPNGGQETILLTEDLDAEIVVP